MGVAMKKKGILSNPWVPAEEKSVPSVKGGI
jgi:hypothetical protein